MMAKGMMSSADIDSDGSMSREEYETIVEHAKSGGEWPEDIDTEALFTRYDSDVDGKLDIKETQALMSEIFPILVKANSPGAEQEGSLVQESTTRDTDQREKEKLEILYREGYISKERYNRLTEDLKRSGLS